MAGNFSGNDAALQIGLETTWGTAVTPTLALEFTSEDGTTNQNMINSNALIGAPTDYRLVKGTEDNTNSITIEVNPQNIGLLLGLMAGEEAAPVSVDTDVYQHDFTAVTGANTLPHFTMRIDRKDDVYTFVSNKINQVSFECSPNGILMATIDTQGQKEQVGDALESLSYADIDPFTFQDLTTLFGTAGATPATASDSVTGFNFTWNNNLEEPIQVADGSQYSTEFDYQKREMTMSLEVQLSTETSAFRTSNYMAGTPLSVSATFSSPTVVETGYPYSLSFTILQGYITEDPKFVVSGPERITGTLNIKATSKGGDEPVTVSLIDGSASSYL